MEVIYTVYFTTGEGKSIEFRVNPKCKSIFKYILLQTFDLYNSIRAGNTRILQKELFHS